jgi:nucleotide-binding universal stress UspA family protein
MKILIGYDGSSSSEAAIEDLTFAGLPKKAKARAVSVIEQWIPTPNSFGMVETNFKESDPSPSERGGLLTIAAGKRIGGMFPEWEVTTDARIGSPATVILGISDEWKPDLIVTGSKGHSLLGKWLLGSVSQKVLTEAHSSVRIARERLDREDGPRRIAVGFDGSNGSIRAVKALSERRFEDGAEALLITADFSLPPLTADHLIGPLAKWVEDERKRVDQAAKGAEELLTRNGFKVSRAVREGDPKRIICDCAEEWEADCIFMGAKHLNRLDRFLLGSVSAAVAERAHCSVEVVR